MLVDQAALIAFKDGCLARANALSRMLSSEDATKTKTFIEPCGPEIVLGYSDLSKSCFKVKASTKCLKPSGGPFRNPRFCQIHH